MEDASTVTKEVSNESHSANRLKRHKEGFRRYFVFLTSISMGIYFLVMAGMENDEEGVGNAVDWKRFPSSVVFILDCADTVKLLWLFIRL